MDRDKKQTVPDDTITQMVDGILGKSDDSDSKSSEKIEKEKKARQNLAGRAFEYFMFEDD